MDGSSSQRLDLVDHVNAIINQEGLTQARIAREADVSTAAISQFVNRKSLSNYEEVKGKIERWLATRGEQVSLRDKLPALPSFIMTPTSERIISALTFAQAASAMTVIYGVPGVGKTVSLRKFQATYSNVWLATVTPASTTLVPALKRIATALGKKGRLPAGAQDLTDLIAEHVADKGGLLIVDEAQHLELKALEELRAIHDLTQVGLALSGNETVYTRLTGGRSTEANFAQLFSRIGKRVQIRRPSKGDVEAICDAWSLTDRKAVKFLIEKAALPGGLRQVNFALRLAAMFARADEQDMTIDHVERAWADLSFENGTMRS